MNFQVFSKTISSSFHEVNQDFVTFAKNIYNQSLFVIADGVGSYNGSATAAEISCLFLKKKFLKTDFKKFNKNEINNWVENVIQNDLHLQLKKIPKKIATTLSFVIIVNKKAYLFHVGDSRIYQKIENNPNCFQLTRDHTENLTESSTFFSSQSKKFLQNSISNFNNCSIDSVCFSLKNGYLIFCTDGFYNFISSKYFFNILHKTNLSEKEKIQVLFNKIIYNGSNDDITFLLVKISNIKNNDGY